MSTLAFILATGLLLLTPGPTNTLLALAGATGGGRRSVRLIAAEILGYVTTVTPLAVFAATYLSGHPAGAAGLKLLSALWVLVLAIRLWSQPAPEIGSRRMVDFRLVYITTVLNPKGLVIGLSLMPHGRLADILWHLVLLCAIVAVVAMVWLTAGAVITRAASSRFPGLVRRVTAGILLCFSASLAVSALGLM